MNQVELKKSGCDFFIKIVGNEIEVSFLAHMKIEDSINRSIEIARELKNDVNLLFDGRRIIVSPRSEFFDVMKEYVFGKN